jgi:hypothetical protein
MAVCTLFGDIKADIKTELQRDDRRRFPAKTPRNIGQSCWVCHRDANTAAPQLQQLSCILDEQV